MPGTLVAHSRESDYSIEVLQDEELAAGTDRLESLVAARTHHTIRNLCVTVRGRCVTVTGQTNRYYHKQLASQAIIAEGYLVANAIEVY